MVQVSVSVTDSLRQTNKAAQSMHLSGLDLYCHGVHKIRGGNTVVWDIDGLQVSHVLSLFIHAEVHFLLLHVYNFFP